MKEIIVSRPNFLASEHNKVLKTITVPATQTLGKVVENNRTIIKAGTIFTTPYYGLLYVDVDITDGERPAPLMVGGYYIDAKLPASASSYTSNFKAQGLFALAEGSVTFPANGTNELTKLTATTLSDSSSANKVTWTSVSNAVGYVVFKDGVEVANVKTSETLEYVYGSGGKGVFTVVALADNLNYANSVPSNAITKA